MSKTNRKKLNGANGMVENLANHPIHSCWVAEGYEEEGMTPVAIVRSRGDCDQISIASFLCDLLCLGVKDVIFETYTSLDRLEYLIDGQSQEMQEIDYEKARELILGSVKFAGDLGFRPHHDYEKAKYMIEPDKHFNYEKTDFGNDGEPFYYASPHDNPRDVLEKLNNTVGPSGYKYVVAEELL